MKNAATINEKKPKNFKYPPQELFSDAGMISQMRMTARSEQFTRLPDISADAGVGASL